MTRLSTAALQTAMKYDVLANWEINKLCNLNCEYCFVSRKRRRSPAYAGHRVETIVDAFNGSGLVWLIHMSGGEPFLQPYFVELCKELTKKHYISINTNLSTPNVNDFADTIDPRKVAFIHCSLHIDERQRINGLEAFTEKYHLLEDRGFKTCASQVMYPPTLKNFEPTFNRLRENGIAVSPKTFRGHYHLKNYPSDYTQKERNLIQQFQRHDHSHDSIFLFGNLSFTGLMCDAGKDFVVISYHGIVRRCFGDPTSLGNIFQGKIKLLRRPELCPANICTCPYFGLRFAHGNYKVVKETRLNAARYCISKLTQTALEHLGLPRSPNG